MSNSKFEILPLLGEVALVIKDGMNIEAFVETGTLAGYTARWAKKHFKRVYTIEKDVNAWREASNNDANIGINFINDDSRVRLANVLDMADPLTKGVLIYLDAHFVGSNPDDECPLREELKAIVADKAQHCIIIDDAYWFIHELPFAAQHLDQWPDYKEIKTILKGYKTLYIGSLDVIVVVPAMEWRLLKKIEKLI